MILLGEVSTGLLRHSSSVSDDVSTDILALRHDQPVRSSMRPIGYAVSADLLTGVDCRMPIGSEGGPRCVGTVRSRAALTGGRVLQGSAYVRVAQGRHRRRLPWSYYLSRPGVVDTIGSARFADLAAAFVAARRRPGSLDLGSIATRVTDAVHESADLDGRRPFPMARTGLRWMVVPVAPSPAEPTVFLSIDSDVWRTLVLRIDTDLDAEPPDRLVELCEDIALHDWLLTTLVSLMERSRIGSGPPTGVMERLRPAIDQLLHLWMPGARTDPSLLALWEILERRPGFSRQWRACVDRVRDQMATATIALLSRYGRAMGDG